MSWDIYPRSCYSLLTISPRFVNRLIYVRKVNFLQPKPHVMKYVNSWTANWKTISLREVFPYSRRIMDGLCRVSLESRMHMLPIEYVCIHLRVVLHATYRRAQSTKTSLTQLTEQQPFSQFYCLQIVSCDCGKGFVNCLLHVLLA